METPKRLAVVQPPAQLFVNGRRSRGEMSDDVLSNYNVARAAMPPDSDARSS